MAGFADGYKMDQSQGGYINKGIVVKPMVDGKATLLTYPNGNIDVIQTRSQVERARNSILYATSGRIQFGNFVSLEQLRAFLNANATNPDIYSPYSILNPNSPEYQYYNVYSTQPNRIPGIRNRF
jgi:hypothetical protein